MADVNQVTLIGRLTREAELKYTSNGFAVASFAIAVNRRRKNGDQWVEEASFFDINLFGRSAEGLKQYLVKGKQIAIEGELRQDRWEQDGQPRSKVVVIANSVQLLGGNPGSSGSQQYGGAEGYRPEYQQKTASYQAKKEVQQNSYEPSYDDSDFPEDIPF